MVKEVKKLCSHEGDRFVLSMGRLFVTSHSVPFFLLLNMHSETEQVNANKMNDDGSFDMFCVALEKTEHPIKCVYVGKSCAGRV